MKVECQTCGKQVTKNADGLPRMHGPRDHPCEGGAQPRPKGVDGKAHLYIAEGRVKVTGLTTLEGKASKATVTVQGTRDKPYTVSWNGSVWACDCDARIVRCAHVVAGGLVVDTEGHPTFGGTPDPEIDALLGPPDAQTSQVSWLDAILVTEP